jgi:hypothetical protein
MIPSTKEHFEIWPEKEDDDCEGFRKIRAYHPPADQLTAKHFRNLGVMNRHSYRMIDLF